MLSTADMAKLLDWIRRVWGNFGIDTRTPFARRVNEPKDVQKLLADGRP